jgi:anti-sigma B factor antagonist
MRAASPRGPSIRLVLPGAFTPRRPPADNCPISVRSTTSQVTFAISHRQLDERTSVVAVQGDLDLATAPKLKWTLVDLVAAGTTKLIIDLSRVGFIDSTAIGVLIAFQRGNGDDAYVAITGATSSVLKIFDVAGVKTTLNVFPTLDAALAQLGGPLPRTP